MTGRRPIAWARRRLRNVYRIGRWEVTKNAGEIDRRTVVLALVAVAGLAAVAPLAASQGVALDAGIYRIGVEESSPYYAPARLDPTFDVVPPDRGELRAGGQEITVVGGVRIEYATTAKGRAAVAELRSTVERYNDAVMATEDNASAAFPVLVTLSYRDRSGETGFAPGDDAGAGTAVGAGERGGPSPDPGSERPADGDGREDGRPLGADGGTAGADEPVGEDDGEGMDATSQRVTDAPGVTDAPVDEGAVDGSAITARLTGGSTSTTPSDIAPPFPFRSLVLAFVFVLPLNFVVQAYGSTMLNERINRRGELLLVAPVSRGDIIAGKTLPYFLAAAGVATAITLALRGSIVSVLAVLPLAGLFLSATFLGAMFARSFKELTFVTVTITVSLTSYAFVPAVFTDVTPIALISPLTLVVRDLQGQAIGLGEFVFSTAPPTLTAIVLFALGAGLYREEDMFTQRPIPLKVLDSLAGPITRKRSAATMSALLLPFVLVTEFVAIAFLFALGELSIPLVLLAVAVVEELGKSLHVYAGYAHARFDRRLSAALVVGAFSGLGFFLAEKLSLLAQLVGLPTLEIGQAALNTGLVSGPLVIGFLLAPLTLHVVTAAITSVGASRGRRPYVLALLVAVAVHTGYNLAVVRLLVP